MKCLPVPHLRTYTQDRHKAVRKLLSEEALEPEALLRQLYES